ncbi:MAG: DUF5610 domain-containing protein [bacterium]|nr:DUF5610 domain-containing protein [bacterium]
MLNGLENQLEHGIPGFLPGLGIGQDKEGNLLAERLKHAHSATELFLRQSDLKDEEGNLLAQELEFGLYRSEFHFDYQKYTDAAKGLQQAELAEAPVQAQEAEEKGPGRLPPVRDGFTIEKSDHIVEAEEGHRTYVADNVKPDDIITVENLDTGEIASFQIDEAGGLHMMDEPVTEGENVMTYKLHEGDVLNIVIGGASAGGPDDFYVDSFDEEDVVGIENLDTGEKTFFSMDENGILHQLVGEEVERVNQLLEQGEDIVTYKAHTGNRIHIRGEGENDDTLVTLEENGFTIEPEEEAEALRAPAEGEGEDVSVVRPTPAEAAEEEEEGKGLDLRGMAEALKQRVVDILLGRDIEEEEGIVGLKELQPTEEEEPVEEVAGGEIEDIDNSKGADGRTVLEVADTINSFIRDMYELYKEKYGEGSEQLNDFVEMMKGAVDEGIRQARDELQALGTLDDFTGKRIDRIQELVHEGIDELYEKEIAALEGEIVKENLVLPEMEEEEEEEATPLEEIEQAQLAAQPGANYLAGAGFEPPKDYTGFDYRV